MPDEIDNTEIKELLQGIGLILKQAMPPGWGFTLFIFEFAPNDSCFYMSSAKRQDMIKMLREFIKREEHN